MRSGGPCHHRHGDAGHVRPIPPAPPAPRLGAPLPDDFRRLLPYIAALELEVDRLRRHHHLFHQEVRGVLDDLRRPPAGAAPEIAQTADRVAGLLRDFQEPPGYHPAHDQVVAIAVRPLAEQVFRWQQRLQGAPDAELRLELQSEYVEWFPARFRHILDSLISNALKYRDPDKSGAWVRLGLRALEEGYELRVSDNGLGMAPDDRNQLLDLLWRAGSARAAGLGVGLAVVKLLVEQSGGRLEVDSGEGQGTTLMAVLPRYDAQDYLL